MYPFFYGGGSTPDPPTLLVDWVVLLHTLYGVLNLFFPQLYIFFNDYWRQKYPIQIRPRGFIWVLSEVGLIRISDYTSNIDFPDNSIVVKINLGRRLMNVMINTFMPTVLIVLVNTKVDSGFPIKIL